jgi:hypothetical protein
MATFTWNSGTSADWNVAADWKATAGAIPPPGLVSSATDVATLGAAKTAYTVTIGNGATFDIATLNIAGGSTSDTTSLNISGSLLTNTLAYTDASAASQINVLSDGFLDIRTSITENHAETLTIAGTGKGGHLEFGSATTSGIGINGIGVSFSFSNNVSGPNAGEIEFNGPTFTPGSTTKQVITDAAWGDRFVFDGANFTGDTFSYSGTTLIVSKGGTGATVLTMNNVSGTNLSSSSFLADGDTIQVVCYTAGTRILTPAGERTIESLRPDDLVLTRSDQELSARPVKWVGHRRIDLTSHPQPETVAPIRILRNAIGEAMPCRDLLVSPDHAIFIEGRLICARQLANGATIRQEIDWPAVDYYHVELDGHAILMAEGLPAESYIDTGNRSFFAAANEPHEPHPDLTDETGYPARQAASCAPFVWAEADVRPVWQWLADRAAKLGHPMPRQKTTTEAGLHLLVKDRRIKPVHASADRAIFVLPQGTREVQLLSRAQSPTKARPWLEDRRRLGVRVGRVLLRRRSEVQEIPLDYPGLTDGWWAVERDGMAISRWTNGKAVLPLSGMQEDTTLEIHLSGAMIYAVEMAGAATTSPHA